MEHIKDYKLFKESIDTELLTEKYSSDILRQFASQDGKSRWRGNIAKDMQKFARQKWKKKKETKSDNHIL